MKTQKAKATYNSLQNPKIEGTLRFLDEDLKLNSIAKLLLGVLRAAKPSNLSPAAGNAHSLRSSQVNNFLASMKL